MKEEAATPVVDLHFGPCRLRGSGKMRIVSIKDLLDIEVIARPDRIRKRRESRRHFQDIGCDEGATIMTGEGGARNYRPGRAYLRAVWTS